jgi:hypothetical protein
MLSVRPRPLLLLEWAAMRAPARLPVPPSLLRPRSILLACVLVASVARFVVPMADPDFWYHIATGRWILAHGRLPAHDLYTFTVPGNRWVDYEYLTEILAWLVYAHAGLAGVSLAFGMVTLVGFGFLYLSVTADRPPYLVAAGGLALALVIAGGVWGPRPQMMTFALASIELYLLRRFLAGRPRGIYVVPPLVVLWANLHAGWPMALVLLATAMASEAGSWAAGHDRPRSARNLRLLAGVTGASAVAPLISPHGLAVYTAPLAPLTSQAQQALINEWQSPNFHDPWTWPLGLTILLLIVGAAAARPRLFDLLATSVTLAMTLVSIRQVALLALAATPMLVTAWSDALRGAPERLRDVLFARRPERAWAALAVLAVTCALTATATVWRLGQQEAVSRQLLPVGAANWLAGHPGVGTRMYNPDRWGGYLAYRFFPAPNRRVYIYGEASVMGDRQIWRFEAVQDLRPGWRRVLDEDRIDYVVVDTSSALADVLATRPGWRLAYRDPTAAIYVRR